MLITVPCRPRSELLRAPDHCSVLGEVNFTNCPLAGRVVIGIRMGIVRPEQAKLHEPLGAFGKRVAGVALLPGGRCPRCTSSMIKCTSASPASAHHVRNKIKALNPAVRAVSAEPASVQVLAHSILGITNPFFGGELRACLQLSIK